MLFAHLAALALAATTLMASGCGSSSKTTSTSATSTTASSATSQTAPTQAATTAPASGTPLTREELIAKGNATCERANKERSSNSVRTEQQFIRLLPQVAAYDRIESAELGKLVPPTSLANDWKVIVVGFHTYGEKTAKIAETVNQKKSAVALLHSALTLHNKLSAIALRDGFKQCSLD